MVKKAEKSCKIRYLGRDEKGRPILEFGGDKTQCAEVLLALAEKDEVVVKMKETEK